MSKSVMGRPRRNMTRKERIQIEALAGYLTQKQIAHHMSMSHVTFTAILGRDEKTAIAYNKGRAMATADIASKLIEQAKAGDFQSQKLFLTTQAGWSETVQHTSPDGSMSPAHAPVVIYLPINGRERPEKGEENAHKTNLHNAPCDGSA